MFGKTKIRFKNSQVQYSSMQDARNNQGGYNFNLSGAWGMVTAISGPNYVDVKLETGLIAEYVPVSSQAWVYTKDDRASGKKSIPPVGSKVFLLLPGGNIEESFVLTSILDEDLDDGETDEMVVEGEESKDTEVTNAGWKSQYDRETGNVTYTDLDDTNFSMTVDKENKSITITDWHQNTTTLDSTGVTIEDTNGNKIINNSSGVTIEDLSGNQIVLDSTGVTIKPISSAAAWQPCVVPTCIFSGAPHGGAPTITGLKGG